MFNYRSEQSDCQHQRANYVRNRRKGVKKSQIESLENAFSIHGKTGTVVARVFSMDSFDEFVKSQRPLLFSNQLPKA